ncbi:MAG: hypothetical protein J3K34DRAFT_126978 [Monoraphidium minutum]|nr:MAG: hypothetical protein J3K34DRAFT_126978 [Monoraphidium minutum]
MMLARFSTRTCTPAARRLHVRCMASVTPGINFSNCVDKAHEGKALKDIIKLPPGALQGLKEGTADEMLGKLGVKSIESLAKWKHYRLARAIAVLADGEVPGKRPDGAASNIHRGIVKAYEGKSFAELLDAPPSAMQGLAAWTDETLAALRVKNIRDLAQWKYALWAEALTTAAEFENADGSSR